MGSAAVSPVPAAMNILAHLVLAGEEPELIVGNFMGDFVKGRLGDRFPRGIARGITMHRRIDTFANSNRYFRTSRDRLDPSFGHYRGILVDVFYDHILATAWDDYVPIPFGTFLDTAAVEVTRYEMLLPERLHHMYPAIFSELLPSYREASGIDRALQRMATRISRPNPLGSGVRELYRHYASLKSDFTTFFPEAVAFADTFRREPW